MVFKKHEKSLRALYDVYSYTADLNAAANLRSPKLLGFDDFTDWMHDFQMYDDHLPQREGAQLFTWSRMRVANESQGRTRIQVPRRPLTRAAPHPLLRTRWLAVSALPAPPLSQLMHLTFEDFLEMLVRLASAKGLPTDEEVQQALLPGARRVQVQLQPGLHGFLLERHGTAPTA